MGKWKFSVRGAYVDGEVGYYGYGADVEEWAWSFGVHYWLGQSMPASVFAEYRGRTADVGPGGTGFELDEDSLNAGFTFHFGGGDFKEADRRGASTQAPNADLFRVFVP
jgi:hypothetical protein